jgi:Flp pilus assembly protein CpaB
MKNSIPLIMAVLLGLAAVFVVSRMMKKSSDTREGMVLVVAATRDLGVKEEILDGYIWAREIPESALSSRHVLWSKATMILGQAMLRSIAKNDFIMLNDVGMSKSLNLLVGEGEWAVPVTFSDNGITQFLQPGDEIAILGTFSIKKSIPSKDLSAEPVVIEERATSVIFPSVRILDIGSGDGISREEGNSERAVIVALPPQQAATLVAAQRVAELYPALRRANDSSSLNRLDGGVVDDTTFSELRKGLTPVKIPEIPGKVAK